VAAQMLKTPNNTPFHLMARLKPGVTLERAQVEVWNRFPNFDMVARGSSPIGGRVVDGHTLIRETWHVQTIHWTMVSVIAPVTSIDTIVQWIRVHFACSNQRVNLSTGTAGK
jgi:hypothetical protein